MNIAIAAVWLINGLFCKVLNLVPRHELIVSRILGNNQARALTLLIGFAEILMSIWILTNIKSKWNVLLQIIVIASMNLLEFILASDLLLFGKWNAIFALLFIGLICYNEIMGKKPITKKTTI